MNWYRLLEAQRLKARKRCEEGELSKEEYRDVLKGLYGDFLKAMENIDFEVMEEGDIELLSSIIFPRE